MTLTEHGLTIDVEELTRRTADAVAQRAARAEAEGKPWDEEDRRQAALGIIAKWLNDFAGDCVRQGRPGPSVAERQEVTETVMRAVFSLAPGLEDWLRDPEISDIWINGWDDVRAERLDGTSLRGRPFVHSDEELIEWIQVVGRRAGGREKPFNRGQPELRTRLGDGSRFAAAAWVSERPYVAIRCHRHVDADLADLRAREMFDDELQSLLTAVVRTRLNVMIAGDYGVGKTTLLRAMLHAGCQPEERIVVLEQEPELQLAANPARHNHVLSFWCREANTEGRGTWEYGDLSRVIKWFKPKRIVVGEVQGPEVIDMLEVVSSGRGGALCTIHADSAASVWRRIPIYARIGGGTWRSSDVKELAAASIHLVVYLDRASDGRRVVAEVRQVAGYDAEHENVVTNAIYVRGDDGAAVANPSAPMPTWLRTQLSKRGYRPTMPMGPPIRPNGGRG